MLINYRMSLFPWLKKFASAMRDTIYICRNKCCLVSLKERGYLWELPATPLPVPPPQKKIPEHASLQSMIIYSPLALYRPPSRPRWRLLCWYQQNPKQNKMFSVDKVHNKWEGSTKRGKYNIFVFKLRNHRIDRYWFCWISGYLKAGYRIQDIRIFR